MLKYYTYFFCAIFLNFSFIYGQQKDTVKIELKHSNILIVTENDESNEWDFEKDLEKEIEDKKEKKSATMLNIGISSLSNDIVPWVTDYNNRIPYESIKTNNISYTSYQDLFTLFNDHISVYSGLGIQSYNISLGNNIINENNAVLEFNNDSLFTPSKNKLRCTYIQVPILVGIHPFLQKKPRFQMQVGASFSYKIKSILITKEIQESDWVKTKRKSDFNLNPYYFNYHVNIIFKKIGFYSQFSSSSVFSDSNNDYLFSFGVCLSTFK